MISWCFIISDWMKKHVCIPEIMNYEEISDRFGGVLYVASRIRVQECFKATNQPNSSAPPRAKLTIVRTRVLHSSLQCRRFLRAHECFALESAC